MKNEQRIAHKNEFHALRVKFSFAKLNNALQVVFEKNLLSENESSIGYRHPLQSRWRENGSTGKLTNSGHILAMA